LNRQVIKSLDYLRNHLSDFDTKICTHIPSDKKNLLLSSYIIFLFEE
jgi:hypothetical protein